MGKRGDRGSVCGRDTAEEEIGHKRRKKMVFVDCHIVSDGVLHKEE